MELSILRNTNALLKDELNQALRRLTELSAKLVQFEEYQQQLVDSSTQTDSTTESISEAESANLPDPNEDDNSSTKPEAHSSASESKVYKPLEYAMELFNLTGAQNPYFPDQPMKFYINPYTAIPHHNKGQNLKIAVIHKNKLNKMLLHRDTTCGEFHSKVFDLAGHEIEEHEGKQRYCLVYPRYTIIPNDASSLWSTGMRYFPSYVWLCPYEFLMGDLMEVEFKCKGPSVDGDPNEVHPDALARRFGARRGD